MIIQISDNGNVCITLLFTVSSLINLRIIFFAEDSNHVEYCVICHLWVADSSQNWVTICECEYRHFENVIKSIIINDLPIYI